MSVGVVRDLRADSPAVSVVAANEEAVAAVHDTSSLGAPPARSVQAPITDLTLRQQLLLERAAKHMGYPLPDSEPVTSQHALELLALLTRQYNKYRPAYNCPNGVSPDKSLFGGACPWPATTFEYRQAFSHRAGLVASGDGQVVSLPYSPKHYNYGWQNLTQQTLPVPMGFQQIDWTSVEGVLQTQHFKEIQDPFDRAQAIWKFVSHNRYHHTPAIRSDEDHDVITFMSIFGSGFCDDAARVLARLANESGLEARIWGLAGHVVPEVKIAGSWRLFDPDFMVVFHRQGDPSAVLGVEDLAAQPDGFTHYIDISPEQNFSSRLAQYRTLITTTENNHLFENYEASRAGVEKQVRLSLLPQQMVTFSNYNWGAYYISGYVRRQPRYYNGRSELPFTAALAATSVVRLQDIEPQYTQTGKLVSLATTEKSGFLEVTREAPLPIVGGMLVGTFKVENGAVNVVIEDPRNAKQWQLPLESSSNKDFSSFFGVLGEGPTYTYRIRLVLEPHTTLALPAGLSLWDDFQFAKLALLDFKSGDNRIRFTANTPLPDANEARFFVAYSDERVS